MFRYMVMFNIYGKRTQKQHAAPADSTIDFTMNMGVQKIKQKVHNNAPLQVCEHQNCIHNVGVFGNKNHNVDGSNENFQARNSRLYCALCSQSKSCNYINSNCIGASYRQRNGGIIAHTVPLDRFLFYRLILRLAYTLEQQHPVL